MTSFANAQSISLTNKHGGSPASVVPPYNPDLEFNKIIDSRNDDPETFIYSIDTVKMLRVLKSDDVTPLTKITMGCRPAHQSIGLWDTLFNGNNHRPTTACVLMAQRDFTPIPASRIASQSFFLGYDRQFIRTHLNRIITGDQIGVAISDPIGGATWILLYQADGHCVVKGQPHPKNPDKIPASVPAINVTLHHIIRINHADDAAQILHLSQKEYDETNATPFVSWLADTVYDIKTSYPWKPHFLALNPRQWKRADREAYLSEQMPSAKKVSYDEFEQLARAAYQHAKNNRPPQEPQPPRNKQGKGSRPKPINRQAQLPVVEVATIGGSAYATLPNSTELLTFDLLDMGNQLVSEIHLTNKDLEGTLITESPSVMVLSPKFDREGESSYLRYFSISF